MRMKSLADLQESESAALTVAEVAAILGVDGRTVRRACRDGQIPNIQVGARILIPRHALLTLLSTEK